MIDDGICFAAHFPCITIVPAWEDEGKVVRELVGPAATNAFHNVVVEKLIAD